MTGLDPAAAPPSEPTAQEPGEPSAQQEVAAQEGPFSAEDVVALRSKKYSQVVAVEVNLPQTHGTVVIADVDDASATLEIPVTYEQAATVARVWRQMERKRPLLVDAFIELLNQYSMAVAMVVITGKRDGLYEAELTVLDAAKGRRVVPIRASDGILVALASTPPAPLMVEETLFSR